MQIAEAPAAGDRFIEDGTARHLFDILAEVADRYLPRHGDGAFIGRFLADDHAEERRLAGAVRPDQADLLAGIELEGGVDEQHLPPVLLADVGERDHAAVNRERRNLVPFGVRRLAAALSSRRTPKAVEKLPHL